MSAGIEAIAGVEDLPLAMRLTVEADLQRNPDTAAVLTSLGLADLVPDELKPEPPAPHEVDTTLASDTIGGDPVGRAINPIAEEESNNG